METDLDKSINTLVIINQKVIRHLDWRIEPFQEKQKHNPGEDPLLFVWGSLSSLPDSGSSRLSVQMPLWGIKAGGGV